MKRRGRGEGSIFQRADGKWVGRVSMGFDMVNHRRVQKTVYGATKDEVRRKVTELTRNLDQGFQILSKSPTLEQFLNSWLQTSAYPSVRPSTYRSYEQIVRNHLVPGLGKYKLDKLTPQVVQAFLNAKSETGISVQHLHRVLRAALSCAEKWELVPRNVCRLVSVSKKQKFKFEYLDVEQAKMFLELARESRHFALFSVAMAVGLRISEALGLRWSDVDLIEGIINVRHQLQRVKGDLRLVAPKTARAVRSIPLPNFAVEVLKVHREFQAESRLANPDTWKEMGYVFTSMVGTPADPRNVRRELKLLLQRAGLPHLRFHDLRHTCATLLLAQGTDLRTIMETLGHSQISLTMNTYSHVMPQLKREAADRMDALLG